MKAIAIRILVGGALLLLLVPAWAAETIRIAYLGAMSGPAALLGEEIQKQFMAAADMVNTRRGLSDGRQIEIVTFDNLGNPQDSLIALKRVIDQGISFVTMGRSSNALAVSDALQKHNERNPDRKVLIFVYEAGDPVLTESKCNFWTFRFNGNTDMDVNVLTEYMARRSDIRSVYLINPDFAAGQSVSRVAKEMLARKRPDVKIVGDDLIPLLKVKDFAPYVTKIRAAGADSVLTSNFGNDLSLLVKAGNESGLNVTYFTQRGGLPGTWAIVGAAGGERIRSLDAWHINAADPALESKLMGYKDRYKANSNMDYLPPIRVVDMLAMAVNQSGSTDPVKIAYALEGMKYAGPSGDSWMRAEDHQMIAPVYVLRLAKVGQPGVRHDVDNSGYGWKAEALVGAKDNISPIRCQMERPPR